ncbi:MAG: hypothetical protein Q9217_002514 [Psora testacea]
MPRVDTRLNVKTLNNAGSGWNKSYDDLRRAHMPMSGLDAPAMAAQLNIINDGCLLCVCIHHIVMDGAGVGTVIRLWASHCRALQQESELSSEPFELEAGSLDRLPLLQAAEKKALEDIVSPPLVPPMPPMTAAIFELDIPSKPGTGVDPTNDVLCAVLWHAVVTARTSTESKDVEDIANVGSSCLGMAVNSRARLNPPLPKTYLGNFNVYSMAVVDVSTLKSSAIAPLAETALAIRKSITSVDDPYIHKLIHIIDNLHDATLISPAFKSFLGKDLAITSWAELDLYDIEWGMDIGGGKMDSVRIPKAAFDGFCIVLPRMSDGATEVIVGLKIEDMDRLKQDPVFMRYAKFKYSIPVCNTILLLLWSFEVVKMVLAKSKNAVGLGNSLMNDRFGKGKGSDRKKISAGIHRTDQDGQTYVTNEKKEAAWVKMRSVTEQGALDEFLSTAELAGTDFTAEKMNNVKIIHTDQKNPYLLSAAEERSAIKKQMANKNRLTVPRRPAWDESTTPPELDQKERASLLEWRRGLADLQENDDLLMTPFERNLEVWRQLWRVIERSDLIVQIVDARHPLMFRSEDLERYVKEVDSKKNNLLLVNKADMMTLPQREAWAGYFEKAGINYKFFSASLAKERNEAIYVDQEIEDAHQQSANGTLGLPDGGADRLAQEANKLNLEDEKADEEQWASEEELDEKTDQRTRILTVEELEELFLQSAPAPADRDLEHSRKTTIGLVGYPNVGKSSTINALIGAKKVSVSSTPGKTKHFQTILLSPDVILCDCPGLVFPNFATTKAELVCNGILPIDQLREFTGPAGLVAQRIPQSFFEALYGVKIQTRPIEEGGTGIPTAEEILTAYAIARGFTKTGQGQPDESRAARYILKDYVSGKLLFCHPPPSDPPIDAREFNRDLYNVTHLPQKRQAMLVAQAEVSITGSEDPSLMDHMESLRAVPVQGEKSNRLDKRFFGPGQSNAGHLTMPFNHQYSEQGKRQLSGRKLQMMTALEKNIDPGDLRIMYLKKHFKGNRRKKLPPSQEE